MEKQLPKNWLSIPFTDIFDINGGTQPPKSVFIDEPRDGYIRLLQIRDFGSKPVPTYIPDTGKLMMCKKDDILIARYGASIGRIVTGMEGAYNVALAKVSIPNNINKNFVKWLLKSNLFQEPILSIQRTAQNGFNKTDLASIYIPLPPLPEQNRIITKLDALFAQLETIKSSLEKVPLLLKDFRQQVLTQAVTGKLTENYNYHNILQEIIYDKKVWYNAELEKANKNKTKKPKRIVDHFQGNRDYLNRFLRKKVDIAFFDEISAKRENALKAGPFGSTLKKEFYVEKGFKVYGQEQVINDDPFFGDYYVDQKKFQELESCEVRQNDILVSLVGTIGKVLIIPKNFEKGIINPRLVKLSLHEKVNPRFIKIYFQSSIVKDFLKENSHGGTMDVLNLGIIKSLPIPLPSYEEQQEIVSRVESLFAKADAIEKQYESLKAKIEALPQAILHKAFKGELSEQLDSDGDARELLEEIAKLRQTQQKSAKTTKRKLRKGYAETEELLGMVAEAKKPYPDTETLQDIIDQLNFDYEIAAIISLTFQRLKCLYGKKYIHKMFSNIELLNTLPVFKELSFEEKGWGMFSPQIKKAIERQKFIKFEELNNNQKVLQINFSNLKEISDWINDQANKEFVSQVNDMLTIYENPIINKKMDKIELFNTVLECMKVLNTDNINAIYKKMENWKMEEEGYSTKAEKFNTTETQHMIWFIREIKS